MQFYACQKVGRGSIGVTRWLVRSLGGFFQRVCQADYLHGFGQIANTWSAVSVPKLAPRSAELQMYVSLDICLLQDFNYHGW